MIKEIEMTSNDPYKLKETLERLNKSLEDMKRYGMDEEILIAYLKYKTKLSTKQINLVLLNIDTFYAKTIGRMVAKAL